MGGYLESGGVRGAIAQTADRVFTERLSPAQQAIARQIFLRLTQPGEGTEDTRRRARLEELVPRSEQTSSVETVVRVLTDERLLTTSEGGVEVAHEALIRHWPALRGWIEEDRAGLRTHRRLSEAAEEWERLGRDDGAVYRDLQLGQAVEWLRQHADGANERERAFIAASVSVRDRDRRRNRRRLAVIGVVLLVGIVISTTGAVIAIHQQRIAQSQQRIAASRAIALTAERETTIDPQLGLLLAIESARRARTQEATDALRQALLQLHERVSIPQSAEQIELSRDGHALLVSSSSGKLALWDPRTGRRLARPSGVGSGPNSAGLSPSGRLVAAVDTSNAVSIWSASGQRLVRLRATAGPGTVGDAPFSPDETQIVLGEGRTATIWDVHNGRERRVLRSGGDIQSPRFSADGRYVVAETGQSNSEVWSTATGQPVAVITGVTPRFSPDAHHVLTRDRSYIKVWALPSGRQLAALHAAIDPGTGWVGNATFSQNGRYVLTAAASGVRVFATANWQPVGEPSDVPVPLGEPGFSPDGRFAMPVDRLFSVTTGETVARFITSTPQYGTSVIPVFTPDGSSVIVGGDDGVHVLKVPAWSAAVLTPRLGDPLAVGVASDQVVIAGQAGYDTALVWRLSAGRPVATPQPKRIPAVEVAVAPNGRYLAALTTGGDVVVWRTNPWQRVGLVAMVAPALDPGEPAGTPMAVSNDGRLVAVNDLGASVFDVGSGRRVFAHRSSSSGSGDTLVFSADSRLVAATDEAVGARVWMARTGRLLTTVRTPAPVAPWAFNPTGLRLLTASEVMQNAPPPVVRSARGGQPLLFLNGQTGTISGGAFSADTRYLVTAGDDNTVRVWDAGNGELLAPLPIHAQNAVLAGSGPTVVAVGNGVVYTVPCEVCRPFDGLLKLAEGHVVRRLTPTERREFLQ